MCHVTSSRNLCVTPPSCMCHVCSKALELGYRHLDCAGAYENEAEVVGKGLQAFIAAGRREELFITSKIPADQSHSCFLLQRKLMGMCYRKVSAVACTCGG
jgi:diketogulonate reductase-like aldo/keto reductase